MYLNVLLLAALCHLSFSVSREQEHDIGCGEVQGERSHVGGYFRDSAALTMARLLIAQGRYSTLQHAPYSSEVTFKRTWVEAGYQRAPVSGAWLASSLGIPTAVPGRWPSWCFQRL